VNHVLLTEDFPYTLTFRDQALSDKLEDLFSHVKHLILCYFDIYIHVCLCIVVVQINLFALVVTVMFRFLVEILR